MTPLHGAARRGRQIVCKMLIQAGADPNAKNSDGLTALHFASHRGFAAVAKDLIARGADVKSKDFFDDLPIHFAASENHVDIINLLVQSGSPVDPQTNRGNTPLHLAATKGKAQAVQALLKLGSKLLVNSSGQTAADQARSKGQVECAELIDRATPADVKAALPKPTLDVSQSEATLDPNSFITPTSNIKPPLARGVSTMNTTNIRDFVNTAPPPGSVIQGHVKREKIGKETFYMYYLEDAAHTFLLASAKRKDSRTSNYPISLDRRKLDRHDPEYIGKLRSNFARNEFYIYDNGENPTRTSSAGARQNPETLRKELGAIFYSDKYPRELNVLIPARTGENEGFTIWRPTSTAATMIEKYKAQQYAGMALLKNKSPTWNAALRGYVLDFYGRVTKKSSKNFQLVYASEPSKEDQKTLMLFGRTDQDTFTLDYQYPLTALQAFAICLSAFDTY
eukprot:TRINITY_DN1414_c0_g1_i1.p1 TRINITY_DN1414_c0_g1~~TRINITY_DN1414_c0_g1_i1.p1  ORF type:complete len:524 (-),score=127.02 TRINITY_DN1414_c0_g1_i1:54-1409(-)